MSGTIILNELGAKDAAKEAVRAVKEGDRQRARRLLAEQEQGSGQDVPCPRFLVNDASVEKLGELLNENPFWASDCPRRIGRLLEQAPDRSSSV
jgi:hypothetical protein